MLETRDDFAPVIISGDRFDSDLGWFFFTGSRGMQR